jgi:serine/threonine protein kinase/tetratricopeptide (TPR) repeat protein
MEEGASFARYTVETSLGDGGMGQVYRAFDTQLQRRVALKILRIPSSNEAESSRAAALILREARAAAALNHIHTVTVFEVGEHEGVPFLAMELVEGRSLRSFIEHDDVPLARRLRWLRSIAEALAAAHSAGIVHLDIKPENVIIRDDDVPKVLDFGIARRHSFDPELFYPSHADAERLHTLTGGGGSLVGTPRYMAPEQIGRGDVDGRTDQFAWGVVAYELLTGNSPWPTGEDLFCLFSAIISSATPHVRSRRSDVSEEVDATIARAMSKFRDDRFASMADVVTLLSSALDGIPSSRRTSIRPPARPSAITTVRAADFDITRKVDPGGETVESSPDGGAPDRFAAGELVTTPVARRSADAALRAARNAPPVETLPVAAPRETGDRVSDVPLTKASAPALQQSRSFSWRGGMAMLATAVVAVAGMWFVSGRVRASTASPDTSSLAGLPAPAHCNEAAQRAYAAGARALRAGDWEHAHPSFEEAAAVDPECAAAHARLVITSYWSEPPSKTREELRRALALRDRLSERDQAVLQCYDMVLRTTPPDERAFDACLGALSAERPKDAEIAYLASDFAHDPVRKQELAKRALAIDPQYSDAWQALASALTLQGNAPAALEALDTCVQNAVNSVDCLAQRATLLRQGGQCTDMEATGRMWIARSPEGSGGHYTLASALTAQGRPRAVVEEALSQRWARLPRPTDAQREPLERAALDLLGGDFSAAETRCREAERLVQTSSDLEPRVDPALLLLDAWLETGRPEQAGAFAEDLTSRKAAWDAGARRMGVNVKLLAFEPHLLRILRATHRLTDAAWQTARARWVDAARASGALHDEAIWVLGSALAVQTAEDAAEAVKSMPPSILTSTGWTVELPGVLTYAYAGRALLLAGRTDDALPLLRRAASACAALEEPMLHVQTHAWLGQALAAKGDTAGACAAYDVVTSAWGSAKGSQTAQLAAERRAALGCSK